MDSAAKPRSGLAFPLALALAVASAGCGGGEPRKAPAAPSGTDYTASVLRAREEKQHFFKNGPGSPVPVPLRAFFPPLDFYPIDPTWRLTLPIQKDPSGARFEIVTSNGEVRRVIKEGIVEFAREGRPLRLTLYREADQPSDGGYWVPFIDAAAGRETYPAGRYLDVEPEVNGQVVLDFNFAYNPYCAYGWNYSCPATPAENRLPIAVRAGEKGFHRVG